MSESAPLSAALTSLSRGPEVGDRIPNFILPDHTGQPHPLYEYPKGRVTVLAVFIHLPTQPQDIEWLQILSRQQQRDKRGCAIAILPQSIQTNATLHADLNLNVSLWADQGPVIRALMPDADVVCEQSEPSTETGTTSGPSQSVSIFVLDQNLRIRLVLPNARTKLDAKTLPTLIENTVTDLQDSAKSRPIHSVAPVLFIPEVLPTPFCRQLIKYHNNGDVFASGMTRMVNGQKVLQQEQTTKRRMDYIIHDPNLTQTLSQLLARRIGPELRKVFHFDAQGMEAFKIVRYDGNSRGFFAPHRDNNTPDAKRRKFALTLPLNPRNAYKGGALRFPEYGPDAYRPDQGEALVFSCSNLHEVTPVTQGSRYVLLSFFLA